MVSALGCNSGKSRFRSLPRLGCSSYLLFYFGGIRWPLFYLILMRFYNLMLIHQAKWHRRDVTFRAVEKSRTWVTAGGLPGRGECYIMWKRGGMKDKAHGPDGIPYSVYGKLWVTAGPLVLEAWKYSNEKGELSRDQLLLTIMLF